MFSDTFHTVYSGNLEAGLPEPVLVQPFKEGSLGMVCEIGKFDFVNFDGKVEKNLFMECIFKLIHLIRIGTLKILQYFR